MRKLVWTLFLVLFFAVSVQAGNYFGVFGTSTEPDDTCRLYFSTFDTLGHNAEPIGDSCYVLRFVRGTLVDSTDGSKLRNYFWGAKKKAYDGSDVGEYTVVFYWRPVKNVWYNVEGYYTVEAENAIGLYWGACDGCYQRLYPVNGTPNKDSIIVIDPSMGADSLVAKVEYRHNETQSVVDTVYFYKRPWW